MRIVVDRDSVAMGDDTDSHRRDVDVAPATAIGVLLERIRPDASIAGGHASWVVLAGPPVGPDDLTSRGRPIGVYAQEWGSTRLFGRGDISVRELAAGGGVLTIFFSYQAQVDPEIVFDRCRRGQPITWQERSHLSQQRIAELTETAARRDEKASDERFLSASAVAAVEQFDGRVLIHSDRYFSCELLLPGNALNAVVQAHDSMAGVSVNGEHLANFRPRTHAEQFLVVQLGGSWRAATGRPPVVLPSADPLATSGPIIRSYGWNEGSTRHNATFGTHHDLAKEFGRYALIPLPELIAAYRA